MSARWLRDSRGAVLLEAILAIALLATIGSAAAWLASEQLRAVGRTHEREQEVRRANRLLTAVSLWPRENLDRHLGDTKQGPWRMRIDRVTPVLYAVSLADTMTGNVLLRTALLRHEADR